MIVAREGMGRKKKYLPGEEPKKPTTKVPADLLRKAKVVVALRGVDLFDYFEAILRPTVERDYSKAIQEEAKGEEGGKR